MSLNILPLLALLIGVSVAAAVLIVLGLSRLSQPRQQAARILARDAADSVVFLFDDTVLIDATPAAHSIMRTGEGRGTDLDGLLSLLAYRFPDLRERLKSLETGHNMIVPGVLDDSTIVLESWDRLTRLTLRDSAEDEEPMHHLAVDAMSQELETLRSIGEDSPQLIWKQDETGAVTWANRAYLTLADRIDPVAEDADPVWPPRRIFGEMGPAPTTATPVVRRHAISVPEQQGEQWFEVTSLRRGAGTVHFAIDANGVVRAEHAQRSFVQTLTKTFAHLSIGLAIFDKERRLVLFNPALLDLTGLPVGFLSGRPLVHSVLDRLRDMHMLPEPKNYATWRDHVAALETAASEGTYCETWNLPGGQTYRVSGRPHPDGAIAFLFEDISAEVSLTRNFRSELETAHHVIDHMPDAIAVFSAAGTLTMSNWSYADCWGTSADGLGEVSIIDEIRRWQSRSIPTPVWGALREFVDGFGERTEWSDTIRLVDGRCYGCRFVPLAGGATMVSFTLAQATPAAIAPDGGAAQGEPKMPMPSFSRSPSRVIAGTT